jgi:hypothetical protein
MRKLIEPGPDRVVEGEEFPPESQTGPSALVGLAVSTQERLRQAVGERE